MKCASNKVPKVVDLESSTYLLRYELFSNLHPFILISLSRSYLED
jgi:hypothetical protein